MPGDPRPLGHRQERHPAPAQRPREAGGRDASSSTAPTSTQLERARALPRPPADRHAVPERRPVRLDERLRQRRLPAARAHRGARRRRSPRPGPPEARPGGPRGRRAQVPLRPLGRHAQARRPRPLARPRPRGGAVRRADDRPRSDHLGDHRQADQLDPARSPASPPWWSPTTSPWPAGSATASPCSPTASSRFLGDLAGGRAQRRRAARRLPGRPRGTEEELEHVA